MTPAPLLPVPLEDPAYFVSNGGEAFPNLIMVLQGYGVKIDLVGDAFISKSGITSSTFKTVPDQPVTSFELTLPEGPHSALAANGNLCAPTTSKTVKKKVTVKVGGQDAHFIWGRPQIKYVDLSLPQRSLGARLKSLRKSLAIGAGKGKSGPTRSGTVRGLW